MKRMAGTREASINRCKGHFWLRRNMDGAETGYAESLSTTVGDWFVGHFKTKDARLHKKLGV